MPTPLHVLILEDQPDDAKLIVDTLHEAGFAPAWQRVETESDYLAHLHARLDVILADYALPQFDALRALHRLQERGLDIPFIVITGAFEDMAMECLKQGAVDYLLKDRLARLGQAVQRALHEKTLREEQRQAVAAWRDSEGYYRQLFEANPHAMWVYDLETLAILAVNEAAVHTYGYRREEFMAMTLKDLHPLEDIPALLTNLTRLPAGYDPPDAWRHRRKDGTLIDVEVTSNHIQFGGRPAHLVLPALDGGRH